jgi:two-component system chemotaxis response regulator CheB
MDIRMPRLDGLEATRRIMATCPARIVAVASSIFAADLNIAFSALAAGALTVVEKPRLDPSDYNPVRDQLLSTIRQLAAQPMAPPARPTPPAGTALPAGLPATVGLIALAAWTGGPRRAAADPRRAAGDLPDSIVVLQHMTPNFGRGFADWLRGAVRLRVAIAHDGDALEPGRVLLAPGAAISRRARQPRARRPGWRTGQRPAAFGPRLFESVASVYGPRGLGSC